MARHKNGSANKSQAIRDYLATHPNATANEVADGLSASGIKVAPGLVYSVKAAMGKRGAGRTKRVQASRTGKPTTGSPIEYLLRVKQLADEGGGIGNLKQLLDAMG